MVSDISFASNSYQIGNLFRGNGPIGKFGRIFNNHFKDWNDNHNNSIWIKDWHKNHLGVGSRAQHITTIYDVDFAGHIINTKNRSAGRI